MSKSLLGMIAGGVTAVLGGLAALLMGLTDPSFVIGSTDAWYPIVMGVARFIGPNVWPSLPWTGVTIVASITFVTASLYKLYDNNRERVPDAFKT